MTELTTALPGKTTSVVAAGVGTGNDVGFQVIKAASGTITIGRTPIGVVELPAGSGTYVATFTAPAEPDLYLVVFDWNNGVIDQATSYVAQLTVSETSTAASTGLGAIADRVRVYLGGETWDGLYSSPNYGPDSIAMAIEVIKERVMLVPPDTAGEDGLSLTVLSYLGKLAALELMPAARDWWGNQIIAKALGDDPVESVTYAARDNMLNAIQDSLLRQISMEAPLAIALLDMPRLRSDEGPEIDEDDTDHYVTDDPRAFPSLGEFPMHYFPIPNRARSRVIR